MKISTVDIFCDVIDNFGDAGVCFRLAKSLRSEDPQLEIRLFTNGLSTFAALDRGIDPDKDIQKFKGISFLSYSLLTDEFMNRYEIPKLVIEAFACQIPTSYYEKALDSDCVIINLDHLSAEKWIEGVHLKESLTGRKAKKYFFMPGFNKNSGGLILDRHLSVEDQAAKRSEFMERSGFDEDGLLVTVFSYEHDFKRFVHDLKTSGGKINLAVFGEKSRNSFEPLMKLQDQNLKIVLSDFIDQDEYTDLLKVSDLNFVRGEDSWARACLSGKPFVWHAYHQEDNYQQIKVKAFLETLKPYFEDSDLFEEYSDYYLKFNDRSPGIKDDPLDFMLDNLNAFTEIHKLFSGYLFRNCNLTQNLLKFHDMQKKT